MDLGWLIDTIGEGGAIMAGGGVVGLIFGAAAQRSAFCLRSATIEFWRGSLGPKTAIWLLAFGAALLGAQLLFGTGALDPSSIRQISTPGTMSGAIVGGLMFGAGMILARGCASRLLVLSATGNLRALTTGLILTIVAQAALRGVLSPVRTEISALWIVGPEARNMADRLPVSSGVYAGMAILALAFGIAAYRRLSPWTVVFSLAVGGAVAGGWYYTSELATQAFDIVPVQSVSFTGPAVDTLMALINRPDVPLEFGIGLVPGVFVGSFLAATLAGEFRIQSFTEQASMPRYIVGACLMGFGAMLAGGCAVGAGMTGGSVLASTAWVALFAMWVAAGLTDLIIDRRASEPSVATPAGAS